MRASGKLAWSLCLLLAVVASSHTAVARAGQGALRRVDGETTSSYAVRALASKNRTRSERRERIIYKKTFEEPFEEPFEATDPETFEFSVGMEEHSSSFGISETSTAEETAEEQEGSDYASNEDDVEGSTGYGVNGQKVRTPVGLMREGEKKLGSSMTTLVPHWIRP
eukprot:GHVS01054754.1.p1 GENE.GHVS01054754.1~~GHVS01054754.1.p1  ORF type:complete len:167 (-),score=34.25 GHVS01054754.1:85-585(-)